MVWRSNQEMHTWSAVSVYLCSFRTEHNCTEPNWTMRRQSLQKCMAQLPSSDDLIRCIVWPPFPRRLSPFPIHRLPPWNWKSSSSLWVKPCLPLNLQLCLRTLSVVRHACIANVRCDKSSGSNAKEDLYSCACLLRTPYTTSHDHPASKEVRALVPPYMIDMSPCLPDLIHKKAEKSYLVSRPRVSVLASTRGDKAP